MSTTTKKEFSKKEKSILIAIIAVIAVAVVVGSTFLGLFLAGRFDKPQEATLYTRDVQKGFVKHYIKGEGYYPGTYAIMTLNDGENDYTLEFLLMPEYAPITVDNFIVYADEGFYDGTVIHRVVSSTYTFQGGGYTYDSTNKYVAKKATHDAIKGEFSSNPVGNYSYNKLSHFAGTISMARTTNKNSATSEFFISWDDYPGWDGDYAAFGFLVDSKDVEAVKTLAEGLKVNSSQQPKKPITISKVVIKKLDKFGEVVIE